MERKFPIREFGKFDDVLRSCPLLRKFRKIPFHSSLEISAKRQTECFLSNGEHPRRHGREVSCESFQKTGNCWISEMRTIQLEIPEIPGGKPNGTEIPGKKFLRKISVYLQLIGAKTQHEYIRVTYGYIRVHTSTYEYIRVHTSKMHRYHNSRGKSV